jgi:hypothetical protein
MQMHPWARDCPRRQGTLKVVWEDGYALSLQGLIAISTSPLMRNTRREHLWCSARLNR